jgi:hypothetical protein
MRGSQVFLIMRGPHCWAMPATWDKFIRRLIIYPT